MGLEERERNNIPDNNTNDIDASGDVDDGNVEIITPNADAIQGANQLPSIPVESGETVAQACSAQRGIANSNLVIVGKGGVPHAPSNTLQSEAIIIDSDDKKAESSVREYVEPIPTSQGNIIPAQGVEITEDGEIVLTAYKTNRNSRNTPVSVNCSQS